MFYKNIVHVALKRTFTMDHTSEKTYDAKDINHSSLISKMIYDIFGGEILKTRMKNGWHFYNWIDGEYIDFTYRDIYDAMAKIRGEDNITATPDEASNYFEQEDYLNFYSRFTQVFEITASSEKNLFVEAS